MKLRLHYKNNEDCLVFFNHTEPHRTDFTDESAACHCFYQNLTDSFKILTTICLEIAAKFNWIVG